MEQVGVQQEVLGFDIGGTKIHAGVVSSDGKVLRSLKEAVNMQEGPEGLVAQVLRMVSILDDKGGITKVGIASAGPLNSETGELLDPTNFSTDGKSWGVTPLLRPLQEARPDLHWRLDNDAAAQVWAEWRWGAVHRWKNVLLLSLGTGVGVGVIVNGQIVRARPGLHPEASHIPLNAWDQDAPCGCGQLGCVEAYLSGVNFTRQLARKGLVRGAALTGELYLECLKQGDPQALESANGYGERLAHALAAFAVLFAPELVVISGGFSGIWPWVEAQVQRTLGELLRRRRAGFDLMPQIELSRLANNQGVLAGAGLHFGMPVA